MVKPITKETLFMNCMEMDFATKAELELTDKSLFALPRYTSLNGCKANSASVALNKWLKEELTENYVIHGFRHSFRDRLRAIECPS